MRASAVNSPSLRILRCGLFCSHAAVRPDDDIASRWRARSRAQPVAGRAG